MLSTIASCCQQFQIATNNSEYLVTTVKRYSQLRMLATVNSYQQLLLITKKDLIDTYKSSRNTSS